MKRCTQHMCDGVYVTRVSYLGKKEYWQECTKCDHRAEEARPLTKVAQSFLSHVYDNKKEA